MNKESIHYIWAKLIWLIFVFGTITYVVFWKSASGWWFLLAALFIAGCASAPSYLVDAKRSVDSRMEYVFYEGVAKPSGLKENQGNCAAFALDYNKAIRSTGNTAPIPTMCRLPDGQGHAVQDKDGWRLDNRYKYVMKTSESDCK